MPACPACDQVPLTLARLLPIEGVMRSALARLRALRAEGKQAVPADGAAWAEPGAPLRIGWWLAAWSLLVVGLAGSVTAGLAWSSYEQTQANIQFAGRVSTVAAAISESVQRGLDLQHSFGQLVATTNVPDNARLAKWLRSLDIPKTYPGTVGMTLVVPVAASRLKAYEEAVTADPVPGYGKGPYPVYPPGRRSTYCLSRFGVVFSATTEPPGIDLCSPRIFGLPNPMAGDLARAKATGQPQYVGLSSIFSALPGRVPAALTRIYDGKYLAFLPVYADGFDPSVPAARDASLVGWVATDFNGSKMVSAAIPSARRLAIKLSSRGSVLVSQGPKPRRGWLSTTLSLAAGTGVTAMVAAPAPSGPLLQGVALGLLIALVTLLVSWFTFHLGRSRERAVRLVDERTGELRHQALHDTLTGLPNRALLFDRAEQMLARARRRPLAVGALFVDLDNFKHVNDSLGHNVGDALLKAVAARLQDTVREGDTVGRLGGDEFLVLTEDENVDAGPELVAERLVEVLGEPFELSTPKQLSLQVRASVGVAVGVRASAEELIRDADVALYQAKDAGKGRSVTFRPEMQTAIQDRLALEMDLRSALDNDQFFLLYQPIFNLSEMTAKGVEALLRWRHPSRGNVLPGDFIPIAEQSGLIVPIGEYVLKEACAQAARWRHDGYRVGMSVNVSMAQFESAGFVDLVCSILERNELEAEVLTLEITESMLMRDTATTIQVLAELEQLGVRIAIDDFGTGYSSLASLHQFPISSLKIDRSFIAKAGENAQSGILVRSLVQLGKALGVEIVAEGIEEKSQLTRLQQERCNSGQGFLFARPLPPEELVPHFFQPSLTPSAAGIEPS